MVMIEVMKKVGERTTGDRIALLMRERGKRPAQELEQQLDHERNRGSRRQRAEEVIARGQDVLATGGKEANVWLRNHLRVWVKDNRISWVELL